MQFELGEEFLTTDAIDKLSLYGREVIKGWCVEDVFVVGGCCYFIQLLDVCIRDSDCQDTDTWREADSKNDNPGETFITDSFKKIIFLCYFHIAFLAILKQFGGFTMTCTYPEHVQFWREAPRYPGPCHL